jgi:predicted acyl esterase
MVSGEGDYPAMTSLEMYTALQNASQRRSIWAPMAPNQSANGNYQLIWGTQTDANMAGYDYHPFELEWFDTFLKGQNTGVAHTRTPLHLYEWHAKQWVDAGSFPLTRSYTRLYLRGSSTSQAPYAMNNGGLSTTPPTSTAGADAIKWAPPASPPTPNKASNILDYTSEPFSKEALLAGPITARFYASSTTRNIMLVATLIDVAPNGTTTSVYHIWEPDGVLLGTARAVDPSRSWYDSHGGPIFAYHPFTIGTQEAVKPGQKVAMDVTLTPRMWAVLPGHRLRLQITTQAPTLLAPTRPQVAALSGGTFSIARNSQDPSYINLPVLPLNAFILNPAYGHTSYTDEPQDPAGIGSSTTFLGPQFNIPPLGR